MNALKQSHDCTLSDRLFHTTVEARAEAGEDREVKGGFYYCPQKWRTLPPGSIKFKVFHKLTYFKMLQQRYTVVSLTVFNETLIQHTAHPALIV